MFKHFLNSFLLVILTQYSFSQGTNCSNADPFCTGTTYSFDNNVGNTSQSGPQYGCLSTQPNPAWFYLKIAKAGTIDIFIEQKDLSGNGIDVDFLLWGPYNSVNDGCTSGLKSSKHVDCSYLPDPTETANITNAKVGEYYILLLTNYSNKKGKITFSQTGGTGKTDCSVLCDIQITETINKPITCFGGADGELAITASNGQTPYTYNWSNSSTSTTISNIAAANYTVTVTDNAGCTADKIITIYNPDKVDVNMATGNSTCYGSNDAVVVSWGSGGDGNFSYKWSNGEANNSIFNLTPGTYTVTIVDGKNCSAVGEATLSEPDLLTAQATANSILCGSSNGSITAVASGGSGTGFVYSTDGVNWSANGTFSNLPSGSYTILVNDSKNCWGSTEATINNSSGVTATIKSQQDVKCHGASTGSFTVEGNGGSGVFNYSIDGGVTYLASGTFNSLIAGYYTVEVLDMDPAGCKITQAVHLTEPTLINPNITTIAGTCDLPNGSINIVGSNGTPNYSYAIDNATFQVSNNFTGLTKGDYTLTIKDANACTITATTTVGNSGAVSVSVKSQNDILCFGRNEGNILIEGAGTNGYSYSIDGGILYQASGLFENLLAGTYTLSVKDKDGCLANTTTTITTPTEIKVTALITNESCGLKNGSITLNANGGTGALQYSLDGVTFQSTPTIGSLSAGIYKPLVQDANGCVVGIIDSIKNDGNITLIIDSVLPVKCNGNSDGAIYLSATGSTVNCTYAIDGVNFQTANTFGSLLAGTYTITVKSTLGCISTATAVINSPSKINATTTVTNETCGLNNGSITINANGGTGTLQYSKDGIVYQNSATLNSLTAGVYKLFVKDENNCTLELKDSLINTGNVTLVVDSTKNISCFGGANGVIYVSASSGSGNLFSIDGVNFQNQNSFNALIAGTYTLSVKSTSGCISTATASISSPAPINATTIVNNENCGLKTGSITINASGGSGTLLYSIDGLVFQNSPVLASLSAGIYKPVIKDANGCTVMLTETISNTGNVNLVIDSTKNIKCNGGNDGAVYLSANGSNGYLYSIDGVNYQAQNNFTALTAGTYTLFVKDAGTCADTTTLVLNEPNPMLVTLANTTVCASQNITLSPVISGSACNTYIYNWLPSNETTKTITVNPSVNTTYTLNVTDCNACSAIAKTVSVNVNPVPVAAGIADRPMGCPELCVNFTDQSTISSGIIQSILWNFEDVTNATSNAKNPTHCYNTTGEYSVKLIAISDRGCSDTIAYTNVIKVYTNPKADFVYTPENPTISNPQVVFENKSTDAISWIWKFNNGNELTGTSGDKNPSYIYPDTGLYIVKLYATSADGCVDSTYKTLFVSPEFSLYLPSAFTPNGDGLNDLFEMKGLYIKNVYMAIFDRWGSKLFDTSDVNVGWNGKASGTDEAIAQGVYVYTIKATDMFGKNYSFSGHVTLLR